MQLAPPFLWWALHIIMLPTPNILYIENRLFEEKFSDGWIGWMDILGKVRYGAPHGAITVFSKN